MTASRIIELREFGMVPAIAWAQRTNFREFWKHLRFPCVDEKAAAGGEHQKVRMCGWLSAR